MRASSCTPRRAAPTRHVSAGFTLLEVLMVIAIVGILASALYAMSINYLSKSQLREGAVQLLTDLRQARSQAQRSSLGSVVALIAPYPSQQYTTLWGGSALSVTHLLPSSVMVAPYTSATARSVNYAAPYGEVGGAGVVWEVSSARTSERLYIKTVGVTGKVMLSASPN